MPNQYGSCNHLPAPGRDYYKWGEVITISPIFPYIAHLCRLRCLRWKVPNKASHTSYSMAGNHFVYQSMFFAYFLWHKLSFCVWRPECLSNSPWCYFLPNRVQLPVFQNHCSAGTERICSLVLCSLRSQWADWSKLHSEEDIFPFFPAWRTGMTKSRSGAWTCCMYQYKCGYVKAFNQYILYL